MPLSELEQYIRTHRHLPGLPYENEVQEAGIDLAITTRLLLQKIEELTLYVIQLQKEINELKQQIQKN